MCEYLYLGATPSEVDDLPPVFAFEAERRCHELTMTRLAIEKERAALMGRFIASKHLSGEWMQFYIDRTRQA